jgi:hypothetical protein
MEVVVDGTVKAKKSRYQIRSKHVGVYIISSCLSKPPQDEIE